MRDRRCDSSSEALQLYCPQRDIFDKEPAVLQDYGYQNAAPDCSQPGACPRPIVWRDRRNRAANCQVMLRSSHHNWLTPSELTPSVALGLFYFLAITSSETLTLFVPVGMHRSAAL